MSPVIFYQVVHVHAYKIPARQARDRNGKGPKWQETKIARGRNGKRPKWHCDRNAKIEAAGPKQAVPWQGISEKRVDEPE